MQLTPILTAPPVTKTPDLKVHCAVFLRSKSDAIFINLSVVKRLLLLVIICHFDNIKRINDLISISLFIDM